VFIFFVFQELFRLEMIFELKIIKPDLEMIFDMKMSETRSLEG